MRLCTYCDLPMAMAGFSVFVFDTYFNSTDIRRRFSVDFIGDVVLTHVLLRMLNISRSR